MKRYLFVLSALVVFSLFRFTLYAAEPTLPPQAQEAFDRGLAAAEQQAWDVAIKYFREARAACPKDCQVITFNLGLAYSKAGYELAAASRLRTYLATAPNAPNVAAVRKEIIRLETAVEAKVAKIFTEAIAQAEKLPTKGFLYFCQREPECVINPQAGALGLIALEQAISGNLDGALRTLQIAGGSVELRYQSLSSALFSTFLGPGENKTVLTESDLRHLWARWAICSAEFDRALEVLSQTPQSYPPDNDKEKIDLADGNWDMLTGEYSSGLRDKDKALQAALRIKDPEKRDRAVKRVKEKDYGLYFKHFNIWPTRISSEYYVSWEAFPTWLMGSKCQQPMGVNPVFSLDRALGHAKKTRPEMAPVYLARIASYMGWYLFKLQEADRRQASAQR